MIPLGDSTRRTRGFPLVTAAIIVANAAVFFLELDRGDAFIRTWSATPADIAAGRDLVTLLTSMFMHAGWMHIIGNMIFLWAFGPQIEEAMGKLRYLLFYLAGGLAAMLAQVYIQPGSTVPSLGASGAIAAVMGAFLITYPGDRIRTLLLLGFFVRVTFIPAILLIGFWFATQLVSFGLITQEAAAQGGGVAYMAHIGGLLFGVITARFLERRVPAAGPVA